ncbi:MAG TPA: hypothetical protein PK331_07225 [Gordonia sp. (in: high G+C Gram-positive bacteria)]|uniref:hypothetical protein n=1 Tax=unclassified Gordonia (in: high G+C Gram-positive bacteria) TaxID=2657482 RepID=UPI000F97B802|nr:MULTISPECIES: hypothetical protein [unclassified Gordonia (in: high G+C Gram-positive bacteria)]RUP37850.1 MAG: hypothetical protein EKK60_11105 [Gordonia sp. (in: high G+C Gram-positive bacteria)]HNP57656.1 hypothetical protein [Gordonia sp. (in: high G+C Gram-positive bacteria)]HRC50699.1 hypothetical protein [Gordonia sp. (in: high G+C Gram-positive bacteria)]
MADREREAGVTRRTAVAVVVAALLVIVAVAAWWRVADDRTDDDPARAVVMASAAHAVTALTTQRTGDPPVRADVAALLTGRLADEYASRGADVVLPGAVGRRMTMRSRVVGTGVQELSGSGAQVLVFLDLWAAPGAGDREVPRVPLARWAAMRKVDGEWLLAGLTPAGGMVS